MCKISVHCKNSIWEDLLISLSWWIISDVKYFTGGSIFYKRKNSECWRVLEPSLSKMARTLLSRVEVCIFVNIYVDNYLRRWKEVSIKKIKSLLNTKAKITWQNDSSVTTENWHFWGKWRWKNVTGWTGWTGFSWSSTYHAKVRQLTFCNIQRWSKIFSSHRYK